MTKKAAVMPPVVQDIVL